MERQYQTGKKRGGKLFVYPLPTPNVYRGLRVTPMFTSFKKNDARPGGITQTAVVLNLLPCEFGVEQKANIHAPPLYIHLNEDTTTTKLKGNSRRGLAQAKTRSDYGTATLHSARAQRRRRLPRVPTGLVLCLSRPLDDAAGHLY